VVSEDVRRIDIVGVDGTVIRTSERTGGTEAVELAELASGVYYVRAHMAAGVGTLPILHVR
jgi:methylmalonyl-CoA mutase N-terminal domain/subunit